MFTNPRRRTKAERKYASERERIKTALIRNTDTIERLLDKRASESERDDATDLRIARLQERNADLFALRDGIQSREETRRARIDTRRKAVTDKIVGVAKAKERVKKLRGYMDGFAADEGFNLNRAKRFSKKKIAAIDAAYEKLAPLINRPHKSVEPKNAAERAALLEFAGIRDAPPELKVIPVVTFAPSRTSIKVKDGAVEVRRQGVVQKVYSVPPHEKARIRKTGRVADAAWRMIKELPAGTYFIRTGEHEAYNESVEHDPRDSKKENLLYRAVKRFLNSYGDFRSFFNGFRYVGSDPDQVAAEVARYKAERKRLDKERGRSRKEILGRARKRARRLIRK